MNRRKVAVLMGGRSSEHEISLISGTNVVAALDPGKYEVLPVVISKTGNRWKLTNKTSLLAMDDPLKLKGTGREIVLSKEQEVANINSLSQRKMDVVFIAMHGPYGEDGTVQGMLELAGIPYTGSGVLASALGMDKVAFRKLLRAERITIPKYVVVRREEKLMSFAHKLGRPPYFIKPHDQGSSVGATVVKKISEVKRALKLAFKYSDKALVDEYIFGKEVTCSVLGNEKPVALPVIEIKPLKGEFFDYESKYTESGAEEIVPARIPHNLTKRIQKMSIDVYQAVGCRGFARVDFILKNGKVPVVLEINTIPGLTPLSLLPKAAKAAGIEYPELMERIIEYALEGK